MEETIWFKRIEDEDGNRIFRNENQTLNEFINKWNARWATSVSQNVWD